MPTHRICQTIVTTGVITCMIVGHLFPELQHLLLPLGIGTNLLWIWER